MQFIILDASESSHAQSANVKNTGGPPLRWRGFNAGR